MKEPVDILAVGAHPDDVELTCGGTLIRMADQGYTTGVLDLTMGEMGSKGSPDIRSEEALKSAAIMGITRRENARLPDGLLKNDDVSRAIVVAQIRSFAPRTVVLPFPVGRHPDHRVGSELCRDACFLAGLKKYPAEGDRHKPEKVIYASSFREDAAKPTFVVDVSDQFERKLQAVACFESQFQGLQQAGELFPTGQDLPDLIRTQNAHYGSLIRTAYGEPFVTLETVRVDDVVEMGVQSL